MKNETLGTHIIGSIFDTKSGIYSPPYLFRSAADFIRTIQSEAKNPNSMLHKFPGDYTLCVIGNWDEKSGIVDNDAFQRLGSVLDLCPLE